MTDQFRGIEVLAEIPAWAWGAFGLLNVPSSLVIYLLVVNARERDARSSRKDKE